MPEVIFNGPTGRLEGRYQPSKDKTAPIALILHPHPHPKFGGTMNNQIIYDLFYMFLDRGFTTLRFNFRGVGRSQGEFDHGQGELSDAAEQRRRFEAWGAARQASGRAVYPLDEPFLTALDAGFPVCSGAALGMDRWLMLALGVDDFDAVLPFREG